MTLDKLDRNSEVASQAESMMRRHFEGSLPNSMHHGQVTTGIGNKRTSLLLFSFHNGSQVFGPVQHQCAAAAAFGDIGSSSGDDS